MDVIDTTFQLEAVEKSKVIRLIGDDLQPVGMSAFRRNYGDEFSTSLEGMRTLTHSGKTSLRKQQVNFNAKERNGDPWDVHEFIMDNLGWQPLKSYHTSGYDSMTVTYEPVDGLRIPNFIGWDDGFWDTARAKSLDNSIVLSVEAVIPSNPSKYIQVHQVATFLRCWNGMRGRLMHSFKLPWSAWTDQKRWKELDEYVEISTSEFTRQIQGPFITEYDNRKRERMLQLTDELLTTTKQESTFDIEEYPVILWEPLNRWHMKGQVGSKWFLETLQEQIQLLPTGRLRDVDIWTMTTNAINGAITKKDVDRAKHLSNAKLITRDLELFLSVA